MQANVKERYALDVALAEAGARAAAAEDKIAAQAATLKEQADRVHGLEVCEAPDALLRHTQQSCDYPVPHVYASLSRRHV